MRKLVATIIASVFIIFGVAVTSVSAEQYKVEKGDNLWSIAQEYDTTIEALVEINKLDTTVIQPQQMIAFNETYIVESGDTLISLGKKFDVEVNDIKEWNDLKTNVIITGQELKIQGLYDEDDETATTNEVAKEEKVEKKKAPSEQTSTSEENVEGETISVSATAYTAKCEGCSGITYTGVNLNNNPNAKVIAVDPNVIPLGSKVYVEGYGHATAADIGGAIKGNKIDIHVPTKKEAFSWGVRKVNVTILN